MPSRLGQVLCDEQVAMLVGTVALAVILGVLGFQYLGGIAPCEMCHWQRWPLIAAALIGLGGGFLVTRGDIGSAMTLAISAIVLVAISGLIGAYQAGMEWHFLPGPESCSGPQFVLGSNMVPEVRCDIPAIRLLGISLAGYNALISLATAAIGTFLLTKNHNLKSGH
jgi:disulfide bond formation protein DsbB